MSHPPRYVILDFETTGLDPESSEIIEIGAVLVEGLEAKDRFHRLVKPAGPVPFVITQLTGISPEMLANEKPLGEVLPEFLDFVRELPMVAHNAPLEQKFLDHHVAPQSAVKRFVVHNSIDPLALVLPDQPSLSMEALRKWAGIDSENAHRADKDCEDLLRLLAHAQAWMLEKRPQVAGIAREILSQGDEPWWWSWYFQAGGPGAAGSSDELAGLRADALAPTSIERVFERPFQGDLKEMRSIDAAREIDWAQAVKPEEVHAALSGSVVLPGAGAAFQYRQAQETMAQEVRGALTGGQRLAIEAPTGTGKSVAYLLPGILAAEATGAPLVVSTHSKSLQDQLLEKDIPIVRGLLGKPALKATTVKGQENYLCLRKLHDAYEMVSESSSVEERWSMAFLLSFASVSAVAELDRVSHYLKIQFPQLGELLEKVKSHHTTTLGPRCPFYKSCHFFDSARLAHQSDVVIANHALVFQWPANMPLIRNLVFDEAHHLEDQITEAYSVKLSEESISENIDRLSRKRGIKMVGDSTQIARLMKGLTLPAPFSAEDPTDFLNRNIENIRSRLSQLRSIIPLAVARDRENSDGYDETIDLSNKRLQARDVLLESLANLAGALGDLRAYLAAGVNACDSGHPRNDPAFDILTTHAFRFETYEQKLRALIDESNPNHLRLILWSPRDSVWRLHVAPIDVAPLTEPFFTGKRAVVLTSATLSTGSFPAFVTDRIGLPLSKPLVSLPSPYALEKQATVFIPQDLAQPGTPSHLEALIEFTEQVTRLLGGRTLLLMSSNRRLRHAADILRDKLRPQGITVFDSVSDRRAAEGFRATERALLIGGERYGEGLDIPGKALSCVIIEKINEAMTRSPLAEARKARTRFGLYDYDFPLRMMWLKQRAGRLIRSPSDTGAIVVFDPRYHAWSASSQVHVKKALAPIPIQGGTREKVLHGIEALGL